MRRLEKLHLPSGKNSLNYWWRARNPLKLVFNFLIVQICRYLPSVSLKNFLYRTLGMKIGKNAAFAFGATCDFFFPELIEIGENCIIGFNATILTHEFLMDGCKIGKVQLGKNVLIGANSTVLAGISIGSNSQISSMSLVNSDIPSNCLAGGIPCKVLKKL
ncbi:2,3,4,5-tetrahydropyridine-2,6-dicarboxylate N-acetyltransferase [Candidatus Anstonella stagnisolia]|nr:2,3,4,5-tetrahydropyridine-2,6-dicarboxylate N-acetyltransferase [Candidatus Anstonella stagnisolia]